ncbi:MAG TPA: ATP-binding cassette domain-containing protein, partial [Chthonomonadaceae bacterium]|nr:ATP-binding cassette domain-containing protein [Chthonomonadaceae bacterium]
GAGKSTLMHILSGLTRPDAGRIRLEGQTVLLPSPQVARARGIAMVHQHFTLVPAFSVAENLALDAPAEGAAWRYVPRQAAARAIERAAALGWPLDPEAVVADLSVGAQQRVEIVKALATEARLLIFDEPTAVLSGAEVAELFGVLRRLRDEGRAVILITHKLAEILAVADRVTVLRHGSRVASSPVAETDAPQLAFWMVGAAPAAPEGKESGGRQEDRSSRPPACAASDLVILGDRGEEAARGVSLAVRRGEIVGIGGVDGNGQTELAEALAGLRPLQAGAISWEGGLFLPGKSPRTGYIPQDRRRVGLALPMTVEDNLILEAVRQREYRRGLFLRRRRLRGLASELIRRFDIRTSSPTLPAAALSGGNQQKIVVARALRGEPEWIVAVNPTRGLDIAATRFVHAQLLQARSRGAAILLVSTDLDELAALSDRAAILSGGRLFDYALDRSDQTELGLLLGGYWSATAEEEAG